MNFKKWESEVWKPERCEEYPHGYLVLKDVPELRQCLEWVIPGLDRLDVDRLTKDLPSAYKHRLPLSAQLWWSDYMSTFSSVYDELPDKETWNLAQLTARPQHQTLASIQQSEIEELENIIEEECPDVQIGNQGRFFQRQLRWWTTMDQFQKVTWHLSTLKIRVTDHLLQRFWK
ncbi:hypothetical protein HOLleu_26471 [Holothuria leucospilota]|uniref:Uncharacterized protein n=1 Tax=Holothuria leucospilota TaxID=206669 RepID=A0A9Q1BNZ5_HOLLE|nr:hypothetical protein HOLleu_26471 [Holothuria leucospilota]